ncbi:MAG: helix-turn-helix domain-containing protein [Nannocystaceae bacterium]
MPRRTPKPRDITPGPRTKTPRRAPTQPRRHPPATVAGQRPAANDPGSSLRSASAELPRLLTIDEVAELLRTTRTAIYTKIRRGALPGVIRLSRRLLVDRGQLLQWLDQQRAVSLPPQGEQR